MSKIINRDEAIKLILEKINLLNNSGENISFIGFKNDKWIGCRKTHIILKCNKHNTVNEVSYNSFMYNKKNKSSSRCINCSKESYIKNRCEYNINTATEAINNKISSENLELEFLGFYNYNDSFYISKMTQKLIIRCTKHNIIGHPTLDYFLKYGYMCPECTKEYNRANFLTPNAELYNELVNKDTRGYDYSMILQQEETGADERNLPIRCEKHGVFNRTLQQLRKCSEIICPNCREEQELEESELIYKEKILSKISEKKNNGYDLDFLGFNGVWAGASHTSLILKCNTHNRVWDTTLCLNFLGDIVKCGCPECSSLGKTSISENICFSKLNNIYSKRIIRQFSIHYYDELLKKNRYFSVDFYLPEDNIIIEYNGAQHYLYNSFIHKDYSDFVDQVNRDLNLQKYCRDNGIKLLIIPYTNYKRISKIIESFIIHGVDITTQMQPRILPMVVENNCRSLVKYGQI